MESATTPTMRSIERIESECLASIETIMQRCLRPLKGDEGFRRRLQSY